MRNITKKRFAQREARTWKNNIKRRRLYKALEEANKNQIKNTCTAPSGSVRVAVFGSRFDTAYEVEAS